MIIFKQNIKVFVRLGFVWVKNNKAHRLDGSASINIRATRKSYYYIYGTHYPALEYWKKSNKILKELQK